MPETSSPYVTLKTIWKSLAAIIDHLDSSSTCHMQNFNPSSEHIWKLGRKRLKFRNFGIQTSGPPGITTPDFSCLSHNQKICGKSTTKNLGPHKSPLHPPSLTCFTHHFQVNHVTPTNPPQKNASQKGCETLARTSKVILELLSKVLGDVYALPPTCGWSFWQIFLVHGMMAALKQGKLLRWHIWHKLRKHLGSKRDQGCAWKSPFFARKTFRMKTHQNTYHSSSLRF